MIQNYIIMFFFAVLVISLVIMVLRDIFGPAHQTAQASRMTPGNGDDEFDLHSSSTVIEAVAPMRVLTSCDVTMAYDIRDVDFGK